MFAMPYIISNYSFFISDYFSSRNYSYIIVFIFKKKIIIVNFFNPYFFPKCCRMKNQTFTNFWLFFVTYWRNFIKSDVFSSLFLSTSELNEFLELIIEKTISSLSKRFSSRFSIILCSISQNKFECTDFKTAFLTGKPFSTLSNSIIIHNL
ncbi:hypothetical protein SAMN05216273_12113 [Chryseobacterium taihuense]|uniref:Uncharacterized protein n=1 Tax=Chryseobacterium taihuense TaxID=1141221 RepID=A0ABY0R296_9FLAO|nr:hypothetical protein SAMN05216273_12113 [Chryseobacterium taihuense]